MIAKGVMCTSDALLALENGVDAIYVSNHGARQLDTTPVTIEVLSEIVEVVRAQNKDIPIMFDGGVRSGADVFKAIALGADIVLVGRPILYGLSNNG